MISFIKVYCYQRRTGNYIIHEPVLGEVMRILIVDDRKEMLDVIEEVVKMRGDEVVAKASTGEQAVSIYEDVNPDIVLMDILLPDISGAEATRRIMEKDPRAKILAISAFNREKLEKDCLKAGCKAFLAKPFSVKELFEAMEKTIHTM
jgi:CheY-like chemotaxis protein